MIINTLWNVIYKKSENQYGRTYFLSSEPHHRCHSLGHHFRSQLHLDLNHHPPMCHHIAIQIPEPPAVVRETAGFETLGVYLSCDLFVDFVYNSILKEKIH